MQPQSHFCFLRVCRRWFADGLDAEVPADAEDLILKNRSKSRVLRQGWSGDSCPRISKPVEEDRRD